MKTLPVRLRPGDDLRRTLEASMTGQGGRAAFALCGIGSLNEARLRFAGVAEPEALSGDLEILTLAGSLTPDGSHLHATVAAADGHVVGGHVAYGCTVRTTAEVLVALLDDWEFGRAADPASGYAELVIRPRVS